MPEIQISELPGLLAGALIVGAFLMVSYVAAAVPVFLTWRFGLLVGLLGAAGALVAVSMSVILGIMVSTTAVPKRMDDAATAMVAVGMPFLFMAPALILGTPLAIHLRRRGFSGLPAVALLGQSAPPDVRDHRRAAALAPMVLLPAAAWFGASVGKEPAFILAAIPLSLLALYAICAVPGGLTYLFHRRFRDLPLQTLSVFFVVTAVLLITVGGVSFHLASRKMSAIAGLCGAVPVALAYLFIIAARPLKPRTP